MATRRNFPYIWTTWLPRLLTGENSCEWAVWFKAHYQGWDHAPSDFDQTEWLIRHTALLNEQKAEWQERDHEVRVEGQNSFQLTGETATLAGKPDLIVVRDDDALIIDVKTGREQPSHKAQLMIYMYALPRALPRYQDVRIAGEIVYPTRTVRVPPRKRTRTVHAGPGRPDQTFSCRQSTHGRADRAGVPVLRHHGRGLSGPHRRTSLSRVEDTCKASASGSGKSADEERVETAWHATATPTRTASAGQRDIPLQPAVSRQDALRAAVGEAYSRPMSADQTAARASYTHWS